MKTYLTKKDIVTYDGKHTIKSGKLVTVEGHEITTLDGKLTIGVTATELKNSIKPCKFTTKTNEILMMEMQSSYHTYNVIGNNLWEMYKRIIKMYNGYSGQKLNTATFHKYHDEWESYELIEDCFIRVYKLNTELCYWNDGDPYRNADGKEEVCCGEWFNLFICDNPKVFPNKSMK